MSKFFYSHHVFVSQQRPRPCTPWPGGDIAGRRSFGKVEAPLYEMLVIIFRQFLRKFYEVLYDFDKYLKQQDYPVRPLAAILNGHSSYKRIRLIFIATLLLEY